MTIISDSVSIYVQERRAMYVRSDDIIPADSYSFIKSVHGSVKYSHSMFAMYIPQLSIPIRLTLNTTV